jgi:hypothetical protein
MFANAASIRPSDHLVKLGEPQAADRPWVPLIVELDDRFHDSDPLQCWDLRPQNAGLSATPYDSNFGNARLVAQVVSLRRAMPPGP